jgi:hypothetical protein
MIEKWHDVANACYELRWTIRGFVLRGQDWPFMHIPDGSPGLAVFVAQVACARKRHRETGFHRARRVGDPWARAWKVPVRRCGGRAGAWGD